MNYEKKYLEALEKARQFSEHPLQEDSSSIVEYIFPELKESEDERIRKALIRFHKSTIDVDGIKGEDIIAWLEKQGEKDKVTIKKGEQEPTWSEKDEAGLCDALWAIKQARTIAKDENDMGNLWYAEDWLYSLKQRIKGE